jgi:hypothetical protein
MILKIFRYELKLKLALFHWITRYRGPGVQLSSAGAVTPILWTFIALSALEIPALHLLLPWETARFVVDIVGACGLLWMISLLASRTVQTDGDALGVNVAHQTSVEVTLREPREILGHTVQTIRLYADQANEMAGSIRAHLERVGSR